MVAAAEGVAAAEEEVVAAAEEVVVGHRTGDRGAMRWLRAAGWLLVCATAIAFVCERLCLPHTRTWAGWRLWGYRSGGLSMLRRYRRRRPHALVVQCWPRAMQWAAAHFVAG